MVWTRLVSVGIVCMTLAGCGGNGDERPTAPVKVTVNYKGKPVEGATVQFITAVDPMAATGLTDASGNCSLTTYRSNDGAIIGANLITISKNEVDSTKVRPVKPEDADLIGVTPVPTLKSLIPQKYGAPGSSGLKEDVKKGQNTFTFDLTDK